MEAGGAGATLCRLPCARLRWGGQLLLALLPLLLQLLLLLFLGQVMANDATCSCANDCVVARHMTCDAANDGALDAALCLRGWRPQRRGSRSDYESQSQQRDAQYVQLSHRHTAPLPEFLPASILM